MPSMYFNYASDGGCPWHRMLQPSRFCRDAFIPYGWNLECGEGLPKGHDVYAFHGLPTDVAIVEIMKAKRRGAKFMWSVDDDWLSIPDWNPAKPSEVGLVMYDLAKQAADWIMTSTPALAATFDDVKHKVLCAPNLIDVKMFPEYKYVLEDDGITRRYDVSVELPVRIVWSGGATHSEDISFLEEPLTKILEKYAPDKAVVVFQGMMPPSRLVTKYLHRGLFHQPGVPFASYQKILNSIKPNVYLCPLAQVPFNLSKSNIRILEGWGLMAAPVATSWGEYNCVRAGHDGRVVDNDPQGWFSALDRMVKDHEYRLQCAINGRQRLEHEYDWNKAQCRQPWYQALAKVLDTPTPIGE